MTGRRGCRRQTRIQNGLRFGNVVSQAPSDVLDGNEQRPLAQRHTLHLFQKPALLDEDALCSVDHDFADGVVEDEVLDGFQKTAGSLQIHSSQGSFRKLLEVRLVGVVEVRL